MERLSFIALLFLSVSCTSDQSAIRKFKECLSADQQNALEALENLSIDFVRLNYPNNELEEGYALFLDDLEVNDKVFRLMDSALVIKTNKRVKSAFGEYYDEDRANFLPWSSLNVCLKEASNSNYIDRFVTNKMNAGEIGPRIVGGYLNVNEINPEDGLTKTIFLTEVVFRVLYFETIR